METVKSWYYIWAESDILLKMSLSRDSKQLQRAKEIVERYRERGTIPREQRERSDPSKRQGRILCIYSELQLLFEFFDVIL